MKTLLYRVLLRPEPEGGYTVTVPSLPGCITYGADVDEAVAMAREAIELYVESLVANGEEVPTEEGTLAPAVRLPDYLPDAIRRIARELDPLQIILFGSWARGDARPDSDLDLLIVMPEVDNKRETAIRALRALRDLPAGKDVVVTTPQEIEERGDEIGLVLRPALREGIVVYAND